MTEDLRQPLVPLDTSGPAHVIGERWRKWKRSFQFFVDGQGITDNARKRALLLHSAGTAVQDAYVNLTEAEDKEKNVFTRAVKALDGHFKDDPKKPFERHKFRAMEQRAGETVDQFTARLHQQSKLCGFQDGNDQIRDQLIE